MSSTSDLDVTPLIFDNFKILVIKRCKYYYLVAESKYEVFTTLEECKASKLQP